MEIFGIDTRIAQVVATGLAALGAAAIAAVAAYIAYRNAVGWRPMMVNNRRGGVREIGEEYVTGGFEVWNRHKYPIVLYAVRVVFDETRLVKHRGITHLERFWVPFSEDSADCHVEKQLDPSGRERFDFKLLTQPRQYGAGARMDWPSIEATYLDPRRGRVLTARNRRDFGRRLREMLGRWWGRFCEWRRSKKPPPWLRERT